MKFESFLKIIPKIEKIEVNTLAAHQAFAPEGRMNYSVNYKTSHTRNAAVMAIISPINGEATLTMILRTSYNGAHSGQVAFAGGKAEPDDTSLLDTAYREVEEEIGVLPNELSFIRPLTSLYIPVSDFRVYPFVAFADKELHYTPQASEVAQVITFPVQHILNENATDFNAKVQVKQQKIVVPAFRVESHIIWGATSMILNELKQIIINSMQ